MDTQKDKHSHVVTKASETEPNNELTPALPVEPDNKPAVTGVELDESQAELKDIPEITYKFPEDELEREPDADLLEIGPVNAPPARDMPLIEELKPDSPVKEQHSNAVHTEQQPRETVPVEEQQPAVPEHEAREAVAVEEQQLAVPEDEAREAVAVEEQQPAVPEDEAREAVAVEEQQPAVPEDQSDDEFPFDDSLSSMSGPPSSTDEDDVPLINFYRPGVSISVPRGAQVIYVPGRYPEGVQPVRQPRPERSRPIPPRRPRRPRIPSHSEDSSSSLEMPVAVTKRRRRFDGQR